MKNISERTLTCIALILGGSILATVQGDTGEFGLAMIIVGFIFSVL